MQTQMVQEFSEQPTLNRQEFIQQGFQTLLQKVMGRVETTIEPLTQRTFLRPPGAQVEALFLGLCTRCDACTAACPHEAISVQYGYGTPHDGTPVLLNLKEHPCLLCEDTPCISACPTEALCAVESVSSIKIGTAVIDTLSCSAFRGSGCKVCYDVCPFPDDAIEIIEGLPFVKNDACTGCGICQHHCPEDPEAITVFSTPAQNLV